MAKKRVGAPWMPAPAYSKSLEGLSINLLVADVAASVAFARTVLEAEVVYADPDFAVLGRDGANWMLHADHTYEDHPLTGFFRGIEGLAFREESQTQREAKTGAKMMMKPAFTDWRKPAGMSQPKTFRSVRSCANRFRDEPACSKPDQKIAARMKSQRMTIKRFFSSRVWPPSVRRYAK